MDANAQYSTPGMVRAARAVRGGGPAAALAGGLRLLKRSAPSRTARSNASMISGDVLSSIGRFFLSARLRRSPAASVEVLPSSAYAYSRRTRSGVVWRVTYRESVSQRVLLSLLIGDVYTCVRLKYALFRVLVNVNASCAIDRSLTPKIH